MEELIKALEVIKTECNKHGMYRNACAKCPLSTNGNECLITMYRPYHWTITKESKKALID